jgi:hypothetical protein
MRFGKKAISETCVAKRCIKLNLDLRGFLLIFIELRYSLPGRLKKNGGRVGAKNRQSLWTIYTIFMAVIKKRLTCKICGISHPRGYYRLDSRCKDGSCDWREAICKKCNVRKVGDWSKKTVSGRYKEYKKSSKRRGIEFDLTKEEFCRFWKKRCEYCGGEIKTIGLDRIDNRFGYVVGNIKACCKDCNFLKGSRNSKKFLSLVKKISNYCS